MDTNNMKHNMVEDIINHHIENTYNTFNTNIGHIVTRSYLQQDKIDEGIELYNMLIKCKYNLDDIKEDFLKIDMDFSMWARISRSEFLDINFMRKYKDYLNWNTICETQNLTESII